MNCLKDNVGKMAINVQALVHVRAAAARQEIIASRNEEALRDLIAGTDFSNPSWPRNAQRLNVGE